MPSEAAVSCLVPYAAYLSRDAEATAADLDAFLALLTKWQKAQNLVSRETLSDFWLRHAVDSLQLLKHISAEDRSFIDLGSGGGLPAIPLAITRKDADGSAFTLVEPNQRKVSFLRTVVRDLGLNAAVHAHRAGEIDSRETFLPDVITCRALAQLPSLLGFAAPFFGPRTRALFHKGREHVEELSESRALWHFDVLTLKSDTSADGVILEIRNLRPRSAP